MRLFRRKKKKHLLIAVGINYHRSFYKAVECRNCGKSYIMDVFGGWAIEWEFKMHDNWSIDENNFAKAVEEYKKIGSRQWFQVDQQTCKGDN